MKKLASLFTALLIALILVGCARSGGRGVSLLRQADTSQSQILAGGKIRFATLGTGTSWYIYGATLSDVIHRHDKMLDFEVLPYSGGIGNVLLQAQGKTDISISSNITNAWAKDGVMAFAETGPHPDLRCITGMLDQMYVAVAVRNGSGIGDLRDIAKKKLPIHMFTAEKGQTSEFTARVVLNSIGCSYEDIISWGGSVEHTDFASIINAAKDGKADLIIQQISVGHASFTELFLTADFRFCQLDDKSLAYMKKNGYSLAVMTAGSFHRQKTDILCAGVNSTLNCNASLPDEIAYRVAKAVYEHPEELSAGHKSLANFNQKLAGSVEANGGIPIHPGALRYYNEIGAAQTSAGKK